MNGFHVPGVYKIQSLINPQRIYIGSSKNIQKRWSEHKSKLKKGKHHSPKLQYHYNKHGESDLIFSVIVLCSVDELGFLEQFYIDVFKPWFNICPTAGCTRGRKMTAEQITKMSLSLIGNKCALGHKCSEEARAKMSVLKKGKPASARVRKLLLFYAKKAKSEEDKIRLSLSKKGEKNPMFGKKQSQETKRKRAIKLKKPLLQFDLEMNLIKEWASAIDAAKELGINKCGISACARGLQSTSQGYIWKLKNAEYDRIAS